MGLWVHDSSKRGDNGTRGGIQVVFEFVVLAFPELGLLLGLDGGLFGMWGRGGAEGWQG